MARRRRDDVVDMERLSAAGLRSPLKWLGDSKVRMRRIGMHRAKASRCDGRPTMLCQVGVLDQDLERVVGSAASLAGGPAETADSASR